MTSTESIPELLARRPQRADARRNYEKLITVARETFATEGVTASLEEIARRAGVGIGTLYRHFPARQDLLEAVYADDVDAVVRSAEEVADLPPWDALEKWLQQLVEYLATKKALAQAVNFQSELFKGGRASVHDAGEKILRRAQDADVARPEVSFDDVLRLIHGVTMIDFVEPGQSERIMAMALDGLRSQPPHR
ncbi:MAG TPA: helix-turn-helix domain-containing protein [Acidimicrobiales bacterium]|jgi:AcrR family transcriptional regulator|nr:helix-turn-helix domain-containing protein [Acidimicrobiales bacterium]